MIDDRKGLPSMSSMARTMACPAWLGRSALDPIAMPEKVWRQSGSAAHDALSGDVDDEELDDETEMAVRVCREKEAILLAGIGFEDFEAMVEQRLFLHGPSGEELASGKPDRVYIQGKQFAITDFKTGRKDALPSARNPQLIGYALLVQEKYGVDEGYIGIVPAWRKTPPMAFVSREQLAEWRSAIIGALNETESEKPHAEAGEHCLYCPFRWQCPEAWQIVETVSCLSVSDLMNQPPEIILEHFALAEHADKTIEDFRDHLKAMLQQQPDSIPGLRIGKGSEIKSIPGSETAWKALTDLYAPSLILQATKWTPASLAKVISGGKGVNLVKKQLEEEFASLIEKKPKAGSLERVAVTEEA